MPEYTIFLKQTDLNLSQIPYSEVAHRQFPMRVPKAFVKKIKKGHVDDPLLKQVWPAKDEEMARSEFITDPVGDLAAMPIPGLLHKYQGRVLLLTTGACAIHCRYCFRRHFPYAKANPAAKAWEPALDYIRQDTSITEVILSGGDPLTLSDKKLANLKMQLDTIPHLRRLRIHTRIPVVLPSRIGDECIAWMGQGRLPVCMVIHANHANEITKPERLALKKIGQAGIFLLNQCVLLKGINDSLSAQQQLSETLFNAGVLPYYLHMLDPVQGAAHFEVALPFALRLIEQLRRQLPGYLVPRLVKEEAGRTGKTVLA